MAKAPAKKKEAPKAEKPATVPGLLITKIDRNSLCVEKVEVNAAGQVVERVADRKGLKFQIIRTLMRTLQRL